jgi:hypothetical protein
MSYSAIIQKDSPAITWSLNESTVTDNSAVNPDRFLYTDGGATVFNTGVYNNVVRVNVPIVYGEKQSIKVNNDISNNKYGYIKVPSLNKMSAKDVGNRSSLEFWVKLDTSHSTEQVIVSKKDVNASPAVDYATCIFLKNDYFVFRLGTSNRYFSSANFFAKYVSKSTHLRATFGLTS